MRNNPIAIVPIRDGELASGGAESVAEAGGHAILIGSGGLRAVDQLRGGAVSVRVVETDSFRPASWAATLVSMVADAPYLVLPASPDGRDLAPRIAAILGWPLLTGALSISPGRVTVARHGGLVQVDQIPIGRFVATLQPGVRGTAPDRSEPTVEYLDPEFTDEMDATVLEVFPPDAATMDLAEATRIVGGGAGLMDSDAPLRFAQLAAVGEAIGASMGATRVVTDAGLVPHTRQIGTTGVVVDPDVYLAFGISGAVQHTAGLGHPSHVISVNTDPHCPMMGFADLAIVADAIETIGVLLDRLGAGVSRVEAVAGHG